VHARHRLASAPMSAPAGRAARLELRHQRAPTWAWPGSAAGLAGREECGLLCSPGASWLLVCRER